MNMVVNKDGKQTVIMEQISPTRVKVLFLGTNIIKEYSLKDFQTGNTSDVIKATGGKTFTQVHMGELRTMKDGNKAKIVVVADEDKHIVNVVVMETKEQFTVSYADFYNCKLTKPQSRQRTTPPKKSGIQYRPNETDTLFLTELEKLLNGKGYTFLKKTNQDGVYTFCGRTIYALKSYYKSDKFSIAFKTVTGDGKTVNGVFDMLIKSTLKRGTNSPYFQDALQADEFITGGWYTEQYWLEAAALVKAGESPSKVGVDTSREEYIKAQQKLGNRIYNRPDRPKDSMIHPLAIYSEIDIERGRRIQEIGNAYEQLYGVNALKRMDSGKTYTQAPRNSNSTVNKSASEKVQEIGNAYEQLYGEEALKQMDSGKTYSSTQRKGSSLADKLAGFRR